MADSLHNVLASFRDSILQSIARLEFQMRDIAAAQRFTPTHSVYEVPASNDPTIHEILSRIESLEMKMRETVSVKKESTGPVDETDEVEEIIKIEQPTNTRNIIVLSAISTPALAAAVAAANAPEPIALDSVSESDASGEVVEEEESENSVPDLKKVIIKGVSYYMDSSNTVYQETEDGYEEVGTYNPKLDRIEVAEEEEEAGEEEEEAIETEEFVYKGQTYQRDAEGNVYDDEGDVIGHWNGKKIVAAAVAA
jgi:hypothetical protein